MTRTADTPQIYLASGSPRRRELLAQIGVRFAVVSAQIDERIQSEETPAEYVQRLALEKARAGSRSVQAVLPLPVLGADTAVVVEGEILGKPQDEAHSLAMLDRLAGRSHDVYTGVAVAFNHEERVSISVSRVTFRPIAREERLAYWRSGEPQDKAGGYAIQGIGAVFIERLEGSFTGVMGLPLFETARLLRDFDIDVWAKSS